MSDMLASVAIVCVSVFLWTVAAQQTTPEPTANSQTPSPATPSPTPVKYTEGIVVSLFPNPYQGHVEIFEGIHPKDMTSSTSSTQHPFTKQNIYITSMLPDPANEDIYFIDVATNSIYRWSKVLTDLNNQSLSTIKNVQLVHSGLSRAICKLVKARNIYWSDPLLHWIAMKPAQSEDSDGYAMIVTDYAEYVAAFAADPEEGYLFWVSSAYEDAKMERSDLLGNNRQFILKSSIGFIDDMTADVYSKILCWIDSFRMTIECMAYDGTGRRIVRRLPSHEFTSIAVIEDYICLSAFDDHEMQCMYKSSGDRYAYHSFYPSNPYAIAFYNNGIQKVLPDPCATHGCPHMCVNTKDGPKCVCKEGFTLQQENLCIETNPLFETAVVLTNDTHICMVEIRSLTSNAQSKPLRCIRSYTNDTSHIDVYVKKGLLYYMIKVANPVKTQLIRFELASQMHHVVISDMEEADDIAFDWVGEMMYSCHNKLNIIKAWDVLSGESSVIYSGVPVTSVKEIAIDPHRGTIYWISISAGYSIYMGTMDGKRSPTKIIDRASLRNPSGIFFDYLTDNFFYVDEGRLYRSNINGTERDNTRASVGNAVMLLIYKNYAIWELSNSDLRATLHSIDSAVYTTKTTMGTINSMALYVADLQKPFLDPCKISNGGCDDLCFRTGSTPVCQCDFGRTLQPDGKSCKTFADSNNFLLVADLAHDRIYQITSDGQTVRTLDIPEVFVPAKVLYDINEKLIYWTDIGSKSIKRATLNGSQVQSVFAIGGDTYPDRMAFDFTTGHLYFSVSDRKDYRKAFIGVLIPKPGQRKFKTVVDKLDYPGGIALHPGKGYLFFNNHNNNDVYIGRAYMDGSNIKKIVSFSSGTPLGMTIDYKHDLLYWADAYADRDKIEVIDLDGTATSRHLVYGDMTSDCVDVVLSGNFLYYVGYNRHRVLKLDVTSKSLQSFMDEYADFGPLDSVDIVPTENTQPRNTHCEPSNGLCTDFCFATPEGVRCGCHDGEYLDRNNLKTCSSSQPRCPTEIANGQLNAGCARTSGTNCGYSCNENYVKNPHVQLIQCTDNLFWNTSTDQLCLEKTCSTHMAVGSLTSCQGKVGEMCSWTCPVDPKYKKNPSIPYVSCLSSGEWSDKLSMLCILKNYCPEGAIANGQFKDCDREEGKSCFVRCNTNYVAVVDYIHCHPDGFWENLPETVCTLQEVTPPSQVVTDNTALVAIVAVTVTLLFLLIGLGIVFFFCRRRIFRLEKPGVQGRYRASPNVYFNASDSRGQTTAPAQGFTNPAATNGEVMPNTNPLKMEQINLADDSTKQNLQNEGHYEVIKEGAGAGAVAGHGAVNPLYSGMKDQEELGYKNAEDIPEKPGYHRFN